MAAAEPKTLGDPARDAYAVTPNDSADLPQGLCSALYIGVAGNVSAYTGTSGSTAVVFKGLAAGSILPVQVRRVLATATTATDIVALY